MCLVKELGKYIVNQCIDKKIPINTSKLQKLLYFAQKKCLQTYNEPMFYANFLAWECGPALIEIASGMDKGFMQFITKYDPVITPRARDIEIINEIIEQYKAKSTSELIELSKDNAWKKNYNNQIESEQIIPKDDIKES